MSLTAKQIESILDRVMDDKLAPIKDNMVTKEEHNNLVVSVDYLTKTTIDLKTEWRTHLHYAHPQIENRLFQLENKLNHK